MRFGFKPSRRKNLRLQEGKVKGLGLGIKNYLFEI